jgi:glycosyltransferase involved in cell wall biosynthesis
MRVALISRSSLFKVKGGDTTQMVKTSEELNKLGIETEIKIASEKINYEDYDLLHFFNLIRPADHLYHIRKSKKPYVLSSIYLDYTEFDRFGRTFFQKNLFRTLGKHNSEYIKNLYRYYHKQDVLVTNDYLLGHLRAMKKVLAGASMVLPNSNSEYERLSKDLGFRKTYQVVPNGIDKKLFGNIPSNSIRKDKVICVGQIYGMKNQHKLIQACKKLGVPLELIGKPPPNHLKYYNYCKEISNNLISFIDFMPQTELLKFYSEAKVHALPSWFETTGLSSLEAGAMGCNLVTGTGGDTREYFKNFASFCDANNQKSIELAIEEAMNKPTSNELREMILENYTWKKAAEATLDAYHKVLDYA